MKGKWYRSNITKAALVILAHIMVIVMTASFLWMVAYPVLREELFQGRPAEKYENTQYFAEQMRNDSHQIMQALGNKKLFEVKGKYDPDRMVDIKTFYENMTINGKDTSGFAYSLGNLIGWYDAVDQEEDTSESQASEVSKESSIIVCKKADETYHYYKMPEFEELLAKGDLDFITDEEMSTGSILEMLKKGYSMPEGMQKGLQDKEGKVVYSDFWVFDGYPYGMIDGYEEIENNLLQLVNNTPEWNGKLDQAYRMLDFAVRELGDSYYNAYVTGMEDLQEGDTNLTYLYVDENEKRIYTNKSQYSSYGSLDNALETMKKSGKYVIVKQKLADFQTNLEDVDARAWRDYVQYIGNEDANFLFAVAVDTKYPIQDEFYNENKLYEKYGDGARTVAVLGVAAGVLFIICMLWLVVAAGRSSKDQELHLNAFDRWKTELGAAAVILVWIFPVLFVGSGTSNITNALSGNVDTMVTQGDYVKNSIPYIVVGSVVAAFTCAMFLTGLLSLARRIKAGNLWKNSVLRMLLCFVKTVFAHLNCVWKTLVLFGVFTLVHWLVFLSAVGVPEVLMILVYIAECAALVCLLYIAMGRDQIKKGIQKISSGELEYKIPMKKLRGEQREIAGHINSIGDGLEAAVEKSLKSERLKTDLITNVSHDIKTPLTSIINYVELLKQEKFEDPKIVHYIEVLEQKSQRLKTLTEDVVEASKVSSGNISLEYMNLNLTEMVQQVSGEIEEKFQKRDLMEMMKLPEEEVIIRADGRRTWRIFENIYNNAAKYAMSGTRVYSELARTDTKAVFTLKNISEQPLNISADELTERFIRGDLSRSTEGSGLGLSIARTLTQMQGGIFELYLDGDLFKVTMEFPLVVKEEKSEVPEEGKELTEE